MVKVVYIAIGVAILCMLASCDPIKRAMKRQERLDAAVSEYLRRNPPKADTMYLPGDTIYHTDTIVNENIYVDTLWVNDTVFITRTKWREYLTTAYVRDTIVQKVSDCAEYQHLRDQNIIMADRLTAAKKRGNGYFYALWGLVLLLIGYIAFRILR